MCSGYSIVVIVFHYRMLKEKEQKYFVGYLWTIQCLISQFDMCGTVLRYQFRSIFYWFLVNVNFCLHKLCQLFFQFLTVVAVHHHPQGSISDPRCRSPAEILRYGVPSRHHIYIVGGPCLPTWQNAEPGWPEQEKWSLPPSLYLLSCNKLRNDEEHVVYARLDRCTCSGSRQTGRITCVR